MRTFKKLTTNQFKALMNLVNFTIQNNTKINIKYVHKID